MLARAGSGNHGPAGAWLDLGCGWGPPARLRANARGRSDLGVDCSSEAAPTRRLVAGTGSMCTCMNAAGARLDRESFGDFRRPSRASGAFEHFCSPQEYREGRQEEIYRGISSSASRACCPQARALLPAGRWSSAANIDSDRGRPDIEAPARLLPTLSCFAALMEAAVSGLVVLPFGEQQVVRCASPSFELDLEAPTVASTTSRRIQPVETARIGARSVRKSLLKGLALRPRAGLTKRRLPSSRLHLRAWSREQGVLRNASLLDSPPADVRAAAPSTGAPQAAAGPQRLERGRCRERLKAAACREHRDVDPRSLSGRRYSALKRIGVRFPSIV